jgi:hypothetical protein
MFFCTSLYLLAFVLLILDLLEYILDFHNFLLEVGFAFLVIHTHHKQRIHVAFVNAQGFAIVDVHADLNCVYNRCVKISGGNTS